MQTTQHKKSAYGISEEMIQRITDRIVSNYDPQRIILFGSLAWGKPKQYSDLDLLIIMDSEAKRPDERAMKIEAMLEDFNCPMDLIVYTPDEVENCLRKKNPFVRDILEKGRVLYAG